MSDTQKQSQFITVTVTDDDVNIREALRALLSQSDGLRYFGTYASVMEAMASFADITPDVLLLDVSLPEISGIDAIRPIRAQLPTIKIVMHSNYDDHEKNHPLSASRCGGGCFKKRLGTQIIRSHLHGASGWFGMAGRLHGIKFC